MRNDSSQHAISFGRTRIAFILILGDHDRFQIVVQPDMKVEVQAPIGKPLEAILARVQKRAHWITKQLRYFEQFQPRPGAKQFVSGETFRYLGRQYRLKLIASKERRVHLSRPFLMVHLPNPKDAKAVETVLREWYQERAKGVFERRLGALYEESKRHFPCKPTLRVQRMVRRWGSCNSQNVMILNTALVQAPVRCIDYVIVHELCHLRFRDHGTRFFRLLGRLVPDWAVVKGRLESVSVVAYQKRSVTLAT
jgi:predicted metal-dependent hydrolase